MIEAVTKRNLDEVLPLIRQYMTFYQVTDICDTTNKAFFAQFGEQSPLGCQFLYRESERVVGFATVYFSFSSSITAKVGILNDLYTVESERNKGVGRQLLEHCRAFALQKGAARLQWVTAPDNKAAQKLYDSMPTAKSTWQFYTYR